MEWKGREILEQYPHCSPKPFTGRWRILTFFCSHKDDKKHIWPTPDFPLQKIVTLWLSGFYCLILSLAMKIPFDLKMSVRPSVLSSSLNKSIPLKRPLAQNNSNYFIILGMCSPHPARVQCCFQFGSCSGLLLVGAEWEVLSENQNALVPAIKI